MKKIKYNKETQERIDKFLVNELKISRNKVLYLIKNWKVQINNKWVEKPGEIIKLNDEISILNFKKNDEIVAIDKPINIVYEDENYIVVNKQSGLIIHPTTYEEEDSLASRIKYYFLKQNINFEKDDKRWGICHRLDKNTSGLIIIAKNIKNQNILMEMIKNKEIKREYIALVKGHLKHNKIKIDVPIIRDENIGTKMKISNKANAKNAITYIELLKEYLNFSMVKCILETGRTHQIRIHLKYINNPVINDPIYGSKKNNNKYGQYLIANKLEFFDPFKKECKKFEIPMDKEFKKYIEENA